jgi:hypothetical protein
MKNKMAYFGLVGLPNGSIGLVIVRRVRNGRTFKQTSQKNLTTTWPDTSSGRRNSQKHVGHLNGIIAKARYG